MKKFLLKVSLITVASILALVGVCMFCLATFSPSTLARVYDDVGLRYRAKVYAQKAYEKSNDVSDLVILANMSIKCSDVDATYQWTYELIYHKDFASYLETINNGVGYYDYVASQYVISGYKKSAWKNEVLVATAMKFAKTGYRQANPIENLILASYENEDLEVLQLILAQLNFYKNENLCPNESLARLETDIINLEGLIERIKTQNNGE